MTICHLCRQKISEFYPYFSLVKENTGKYYTKNSQSANNSKSAKILPQAQSIKTKERTFPERNEANQNFVCDRAVDLEISIKTEPLDSDDVKEAENTDIIVERRKRNINNKKMVQVNKFSVKISFNFKIVLI